MDSCCICLEKTFPKSEHAILMTPCNHIFHKKCIILANFNKTVSRCSLCRAELDLPNIEKIKYQLNETELNTFPELQDLYNLMDNFDELDWVNLDGELLLKSWFISGGYAVYLYLKLIEKKAMCFYGDNINIYTVNNNIFFNNLKVNLHDLKNNIKYDSKFIEFNAHVKIGKLKRTRNENFLSVKKDHESDFSSVLDCTKMISESVHIEKKTNIEISKINCLLKYSKNKDRIFDILNEFDLSCCKIAIMIKKTRGLLTLKFYIHKDFWCNIYSSNVDCMSNRLFKYKLRGFDLIEFE